MGNNYFRFKQFELMQAKPGFKVGTDGVLLGAAVDVSGKTRVLDVGTGTGLLALMIAQRCGAFITAIEPDREAFFQARDNIKRSRWADRIEILNCSLQDYWDSGNMFDLIITNPPYFIKSLKNPDTRKALTRHNDKLDHSDILEGAGKLLTESGDLQLIMPSREGKAFRTLAAERGFYCNGVMNIKPTLVSEVKRLIMNFSRKKKPFHESYLAIEKGRRFDFTEDYIALTGDFYLRF